MRDEAVIALLLVLVIASAGGGYYVGNSSRQTVTTTSTQIISTTVLSTATLPIATTETSFQPTTVTSTDYLVLNPINESASTLAPDGIRLTLSVNASELEVGQKLQVSMSLKNTLTTSDTLQNTQSKWPFHGVYVSLWPECDTTQPAQMVILKGTYDLKGLQSNPYTSVSTDPLGWCTFYTVVTQFTFLPNSDDGATNGTFYSSSISHSNEGPFSEAVNFTTTGYWNMTSIAEGPVPTYVWPVNTPMEYYGGGLSQPASVPFMVGNYTLAVSDEWGQYAILHFEVL